MAATAMNGHGANQGANGSSDSSDKSLEEQLSGCPSTHRPDRCLAQLGDADYSQLLPQRSLPPEVLERVVHHLQQGVLIGDPIAHRTLVRISSVSRLMRHWAFEALYSIVILPRHVREFRKWYARSVKAQPASQFAGYTQALFSSLDDVSALTSFLGRMGSRVLYDAALLRTNLDTSISLARRIHGASPDPGQVREGYRFGTSNCANVGRDGRSRRRCRGRPG